MGGATGRPWLIVCFSKAQEWRIAFARNEAGAMHPSELVGVLICFPGSGFL